MRIGIVSRAVVGHVRPPGSTRDVGPPHPQVVWAVRHDWPGGTHSFARPRRSAKGAQRELVKAHRFWCQGPGRPRLSVVEVSLHDLRVHGRFRQWCKAPDCPAASSTGKAVRQ